MEINLVVGKLILIHPLAANGTDAGLYNQSMCLKYVLQKFASDKLLLMCV